MRSLRELLDAVPLPPAEAGEVADYALPNASLLGADLPAGHVHLWSGPPGAGKTAFLLGLLHDAARHGRPVVFATYDLPAPTLALRLLAMASGVPLHDLEPGRLTPDEARAAARARARLRPLPFRVLEARGLGVASIDDRLLRSGTRAAVLGVDFLEAIVRPAGRPVASAVAELSELAARRFLAVVCASRAPLDALAGAAAAPDRVGRLSRPTAEAAAPVVEAQVVENRHGGRPSCRLRVDAPAGRLLADEGTAEGHS
jgi:hypothetical protein